MDIHSISLPCCSGAAVGRLGLGLGLVLVLGLRLGLIISVGYSQRALLSICALPSKINCRPDEYMSTGTVLK